MRVRVTFARREVERGVAAVRRRARVRAGIEEQCGRLGVAGLGRGVQRRRAVVVSGVDVGRVAGEDRGELV